MYRIHTNDDGEDEQLETVLLHLDNLPNSTGYILGPNFQAVVSTADDVGVDVYLAVIFKP